MASTVVVLSLFLTSTVCAQSRDPVVAGWQAELEEIDQLIRTDRCLKAEKRARKLAEDVVERVLTGRETLTRLSLLRAMAAACLGDEREAQWHWTVAEYLRPDLVEAFDRSGYKDGEVAASALEASGCGLLSEPEPTEDITPPRKLRAPSPMYPRGTLSLVRGPVAVRVCVLLRWDGLPTHPEVVDPRDQPALVFAALDALRDWRFAPPEEDGNPVAAWYHLTVNFGKRK